MADPHRLNGQPGGYVENAHWRPGCSGRFFDQPARSFFFPTVTNASSMRPGVLLLTLDKRHPELDVILGTKPAMGRVAAGFVFTEGPVWRRDHLLFSDIPNSRIIRLEQKEEGPEVTTFRHPSGNANGHTLDLAGRLISCEHSTRRVTRTEADGSMTVLASKFEGKKLNSPNDVAVALDGAIYFTDPTFGLPRRIDGKELGHQGVYRVDPNSKDLSLVAHDFDLPNGLAFSPNGSRLYVNDSAKSHVRVFDLASDGSLRTGEVFAELAGNSGEAGVPDGMKVDSTGNVYCTGPGGLWIFTPDGMLVGRVICPEQPSNCGWGGEDWQTLFITARTGVYSMRVEVAGVPV